MKEKIKNIAEKKKFEVLSAPTALKFGIAAGFILANTSLGFCAPQVNNLGSMMQNVVNLAIGFLAAFGIIQLVIGIKNFAAGLTDDGAGQDQQAMSKGKGQIIRGAICVAAAPIILAITGINTDSISGLFN